MEARQGRIAEYHWAEFKGEEPELSLPAVVRGLARYIKGLRAVNVSWDSGRLSPSDSVIDNTWTFQDGYAVTPLVGDELIVNWPESGESFDEWYFFREVPASLALAPYCNWTDASVANWQDYNFHSDLGAQLARTRPELVIGAGHRVYVISYRESVVSDFLRLVEKE